MHSACSIDEVSKPQRPFALSNAARDDNAGKPQAPPSKSAEDDPVLAALHSRLEVLEAELVRLTNLASSTTADPDQQKTYWDLAQQLQRDVREARAAIQSRTQFRE